MKPLLFSACIVTHRNIDRTLASIAGVVDEAVVVIDPRHKEEMLVNSTPVQLIVEPRPWDNDFSAARNRSVELAAGEWILYIDSDEWLVFEEGCSADQLRTVLETTTADAFWIPFHNWMNEDKTSRSMSRMMRIFRKKGAHFEQPVQNALMGHPVGEQMLGLHIEHDGYDSRKKMMEKANARMPIYNKLIADKDNDDNWHVWYNYAKNCWFAGDIPKCLEAAAAAIKLLRKGGMINENTPYVDIYRIQAICQLSMGDYDGADKSLLDGALCACPRYSDAYYELYLVHGLLADHHHKCWEAERKFRGETGDVPAYDLVHLEEVAIESNGN